MKLSEQRQNEARGQHTEAIVARHVSELFRRLSMLSGFWLRPDLAVPKLSTASRPARLRARVVGTLARYLAEPVSRPAAPGDVLALSALLRPGDVLLTEGDTRAAALVRCVTRSPWAHVSVYVGPLEAGADVEDAHVPTAVGAFGWRRPNTPWSSRRAAIFARYRWLKRHAMANFCPNGIGELKPPTPPTWRGRFRPQPPRVRALITSGAGQIP